MLGFCPILKRLSWSELAVLRIAKLLGAKFKFKSPAIIEKRRQSHHLSARCHYTDFEVVVVQKSRKRKDLQKYFFFKIRKMKKEHNSIIFQAISSIFSMEADLDCSQHSSFRPKIGMGS